MIQHADNKEIRELFDSDRPSRYVVPKYQREYVWGKWNWDALFDDLIERDAGEGHFLGTFICVNRESDSSAPPTFDVIDGQQRLTTLSLLLAATYHVFMANKSDEDDDQTRAGRLALQKMLVMDRRARLSPQKAGHNGEDYLSVLKDAGLELDASKPTRRGNRRIERAFRHFTARIAELAEADRVSEYAVAKDVLARVRRAQMVKIEVASYADAFVLFESLNNRGTPLTPVDLIKTSLLAKADRTDSGTSLDSAYSAWEEWTQRLGDDYSAQERFFRQLYNAMRDEWGWVVKNAPIARKSNLIRVYEELIDRDVVDLIGKLGPATEAYEQLTDTPSPSSRTSGLAKALADLVRAEGATSHVLLIFLLLRRTELGLTDAELADLVRLLTSFSVRRNLTNVPATYSLQPFFMEIVTDLRSDPSDVRGTVLKKLKAVSASDDQVAVALGGPIYEESTNVVRFLLVRLAEEGMNDQSWHDLWERRQSASGRDNFVWTIEHVLPQSENLNPDWVRMLGGEQQAKDVQESSVHRLGNLTLTPYNSSLGKLSFAEKRDRQDTRGLPIGYRNDLVLNSDLATRNDWTRAAIEARTLELTNKVLALFPLR